MSAYICDKQHIIYLVAAATSRRINQYGGGFSWYWGNPAIHAQLHAGDTEQAVEVANMLLRENIASVSHRYPNESSATLPGPCEPEIIEPRDFNRDPFEQFDPVQVLKSCQCLEYQSCEHPAWEQSEAFAFLRALRAAAVHALPGYEDAAWGAPERKQPCSTQSLASRATL